MNREEMVEEIKMGESNFKKQRMAIFKYFPTKPRGRIGNGYKPKYFTENSFDSAVMAKRYLAVPYEPLYRVKIKPDMDPDKLWEEFEGGSKGEVERRVWASFGLHGGGWERQTRQKFLKKESRRGVNTRLSKGGYSGVWSIDKELLSGGYMDEYSGYSKTTEYGSITSLLKMFLQSYKQMFLESYKGRNEKFIKEAGNFRWKVPDDFMGGVFYWKIKPFEYTISVQFKICEDICNGIKFWGVFWKDGKNRRTLYKPIEMTVPGFPLLKKHEIRNSSPEWFKDFLNDNFNSIREALVDKVVAILKQAMVPRGVLVESYDIRLL